MARRTCVSRRLTRGASSGTQNSPYKGKVTAYDSPIYIADARRYLKATQPDLGIEDPYELDDAQFEAAVDLLKQQRQIIGEYWSDYTEAAARPSRPADSVRRDDLAGDRERCSRRREGPGRDRAAEGGLDRVVGHRG